MSFGERFGAVAAWAVRHARVVLALSAALAIAAAVAATRLPVDAGTDTLVDSGSASFRATDEERQLFGDDPVVILARGDLRQLLLTKNLGQLLRLEGCLAGNPPPGVKPLPGPCTEMARLKPAKLVYGPATFLNQAVIAVDQLYRGQIRRVNESAQTAGDAAVKRAAAAGGSIDQQRQAGRAAFAEAKVAAEQALFQAASQIATRYGITRLPQLGDRLFISKVVFDERQTGGTPKAKLSYLFPNRNSAQIIVRLRPDLTDSERHQAIGLIQDLASETKPRAACGTKKEGPQPCFALTRGSYVVSGAPVVVDGLAGSLENSLLVLLAVAVALMALTLLVVFRTRMRLLPLAIALGATAVTFGLLGLLGGSLTMASIAVLPVLIGLSVDYAIQLHARHDEVLAEGATGAEAARQAAARGAPVIATACLATAAGFAVLQLSPTPMVRSFGLLLVVGIGVALLLALTAGFAALSLRRSAPHPREPRRSFAWMTRAAGRRDRVAEMLGRFSRNSLAVSISNPGRVLAVGAALALCGWVAGTGTKTISDIRELVPQNLSEIRSLNELQDATGVSGELDVSVTAPDLADPAVIRWMGAFKQRVLADNGFGGRFPSCHDSEICPGPALSDLFPPRGPASPAAARALLAELPAYDLQGIVAQDPKTGSIGHTANIAFGIRAQSLTDQQALIDRVRNEIDNGPGTAPPPGVTVQLAGLPVLAAETATDLSNSRYWLTLAGLIAVALMLLLIYRSPRRALVPLIPIALATGWSSLVLAAMGIALNPMSAALGALVIAIATEFSVILASRYHEERGGGRSVGESLRQAYSRTGAAVLASGVTAIAGFATLIASDVRMLRDFGFVTVIDLAVALLGVMLVLPAALVWAERGFPALAREGANPEGSRRWRRTRPAP